MVSSLITIRNGSVLMCLERWSGDALIVDVCESKVSIDVVCEGLISDLIIMNDKGKRANHN
jgi:hypothetical protein